MRFIAFIAIIIVAYGVYKEYSKYSKLSASQEAPIIHTTTSKPVSQPALNFKCDGRKYCSQMRSCAEATFFLQHCPTVKMDGDNDGIPCERQLCGH